MMPLTRRSEKGCRLVARKQPYKFAGALLGSSLLEGYVCGKAVIGVWRGRMVARPVKARETRQGNQTGFPRHPSVSG